MWDRTGQEEIARQWELTAGWLAGWGLGLLAAYSIESESAGSVYTDQQ